MAVAVSGGADSMALLWVVWHQASILGLNTWAFHVQHGLQAQAREWPSFIEEECGRWAALRPEFPPIRHGVAHLPGLPSPGQSVEAWARDERYAALVGMAKSHGLGLVLLAHHRRDQAETVLLQALRGAGPRGLAGMPRLFTRDGVVLARPWLRQPPEWIHALGEKAGLRHVHDPSNDDPRWARNRLRHEVWPALTRSFKQAEAALALSALRCAQALEPLERGISDDWQRVVHAGSNQSLRLALDVAVWQSFSVARRSHVLRHWLEALGIEAPGSAIDRIAAHGKIGQSAYCWPLTDRQEVRAYRGELSLVERGNPKPVKVPGAARPVVQTLVLRRSGRRRIHDWAGWLILRRAEPGEQALVESLPLTVSLRSRMPGDQFQCAPKSAARSLKKQFQAAAVPPWAREAPVVTDAQGQVLMVPGLGMDARACAASGRWVLEWASDGPASVGPASAAAL